MRGISDDDSASATHAPHKNVGAFKLEIPKYGTSVDEVVEFANKQLNDSFNTLARYLDFHISLIISSDPQAFLYSLTLQEQTYTAEGSITAIFFITIPSFFLLMELTPKNRE